MNSAKLFIISALLGITQFLNVQPSEAQSQGPNGFDWIGGSNVNVDNQRCSPSAHFAGNPMPVTMAATSWIAPGNASSFYDFTRFEFVGGIIPAHTNQGSAAARLATSTDLRVTIYDSFDNMQRFPSSKYRARFQVAAGSPALSNILSTPGCRFWVAGFTYPIQCGRLQIDLEYLNNIGSVEYRDQRGIVTNTPFRVTGGRRYFIALTGDPGIDSNNELLTFCAVRTNLDLPSNRSDAPTPVISFPLSPSQCAEAAVPDCTFRLAHADYFWQNSGLPAVCNVNRTPVNYYEGISQYPPYFSPSTNGTLPRTCGGTTSIPCCERAMPMHWAYGLGVRRYNKFSHLPERADTGDLVVNPGCSNC